WRVHRGRPLHCGARSTPPNPGCSARRPLRTSRRYRRILRITRESRFSSSGSISTVNSSGGTCHIMHAPGRGKMAGNCRLALGLRGNQSGSLRLERNLVGRYRKLCREPVLKRGAGIDADRLDQVMDLGAAVEHCRFQPVDIIAGRPFGLNRSHYRSHFAYPEYREAPMAAFERFPSAAKFVQATEHPMGPPGTARMRTAFTRTMPCEKGEKSGDRPAPTASF